MAPLKDPDWDTYRVWELRAVRQFPPPEKHVPRKTLIDKALAEWQRKSRQTEYADIVRALQKAEVEAGKADKKIYTIPKKLKAGNDALADAQRKRHQTLVASRKAWQAVITLLRDLRTEQEETDNNGDVIANKRAIDYTNYLDEQARARVAALEQSIKQSREARGSKLAAVSESEDQPDVEGNEVQATVQAAENGQTGASGDAATTGGQKSPSKGSQRSSGKRSASQLDEPGADSRLSEAQRPRKSTRRSSTAQSGPSDRNESGGALTNGNTSSMPAGAELNEDSDALRVGKNFVASWDAIEMLGPPDSEGSSRWRDELASLRDRATKLFEDKDVKIVPQLSKNTLGKVLANVQARIKEAETHTTALSQATLLSNASALPMQTKDFYARWNELLELAKSTGKYTEEWDKKIRARCPIAARLLINNGAVIVPEIRDDTDPIQELEDLAEMIKRVQAENGENSRKREKLRKDKYKSSKELGFADSGGASPFRGEFVFWKVIEVGGTSAPALWVCHDEDGHIIDRVAVKDVWVPDNEWSTRLPWVGEVDERKPREGTMHRVVSRTNSEYVVQYRAHAVMFREKVLRSYMELCRYGEFWDMWCDQMGDWQHEVRFSDRYLCVPAIWAFFECLAKAAHVMTFGCLPERAEPADWEGILHRDIKANNVFMTDPDERRCPGTPKMKLGDFGYAALVSEERELQDLRGTPGLIPPEISHPKQRPRGVEVSSPADIFTIGMTMLETLNYPADAPGDEAVFEFGIDEASQIPRVDGTARGFYPAAMIELIHACIRLHPKDTIGVKELCRRINEEVKDLCMAELTDADKARLPYKHWTITDDAWIMDID